MEAHIPYALDIELDIDRDFYLDHDLEPHELEHFERARQGLEANIYPTPTQQGSSGSYLMYVGQDICVAVFKPVDEERGCPSNPRGKSELTDVDQGYVIGQGAQRECIAYLLDKLDGVNTFAGVPPTLMVKCQYSIVDSEGNVCGDFIKRGSLQRYVEEFPKSIDNNGNWLEVNNVLRDNIHKIAVLDLRLGNLDRNLGNMLLRNGDTLVPIDHGCCLPNDFIYANLWWTTMDQTRMEFCQEIRDYIESLDSTVDITFLHTFGIHLSLKCQIGFHTSTYLLMSGARRGLCAHGLGYLMATEVDDERSTCSLQLMLFEIYNALHLYLDLDTEVEEDLKIDLSRIYRVVDRWLDRYQELNDEQYQIFLNDQRLYHEHRIMHLKTHYHESF